MPWTNPELGVELPARSAATIRKVRVMRRSLVVLAVLATLAGCQAGGSVASSPTAATGAEPVAEALRFTAAVVGGGNLDAATLAGQPVAFWFWAPT